MFLTSYIIIITIIIIDRSCFSLEPRSHLMLILNFFTLFLLHDTRIIYYAHNWKQALYFFFFCPVFDTRRQHCPVVVIVSVHLWFAGCSCNIALRPRGQCLHISQQLSCTIPLPTLPLITAK